MAATRLLALCSHNLPLGQRLRSSARITLGRTLAGPLPAHRRPGGQPSRAPEMAHPCAAALPWGAELQCGPHEAPCDPPPHALCRARPNRARCRRPRPARRCAGTPLPPRNNTQQGSSSEDACALPRGERQGGARLGLSSPPRRPARPKHWHRVALLRHTWRWAERGAHRRQFLRNGVHASHTSCDRATRTSSRRTKPRRRLSEASPGSCSDTTAEPRCGSDGAGHLDLGTLRASSARRGFLRHQRASRHALGARGARARRAAL